MNEKNNTKLIGPMAAVFAIALIAILGALWMRAVQADDNNKIKEQNLVSVGISRMAETSAQLMTPMTIWDTAVINTTVKFDREWVHRNFGTYFKLYNNYERSFVLNGADQPVYAAFNGHDTDLKVYEEFQTQITPLARELRKRLPSMYAPNAVGNRHDFAARMIGVDGKLFIMGASLILPDSGDPKLRFPAPYMVVSMHEVTEAELKQLSNSYMINPIQLVQNNHSTMSDQAWVSVRNARNQIMAAVTWSPDQPGRSMFLQTVVPVLLVTVMLGVFALYMLYRSQKIASHLQISEAKAKHMALHDGLTGLPNRTLFADRLIQARERIKRKGGAIAVMCIGMDRFKDINDTLGHAAGDELIRYIAQSITTMIRSGDTVARLGGDEFVIIQTDTDAHAASTLAKRVMDTLTGNVVLESGQVFSSCSIGVTLIVDGEIEPAEALRQADLALYRAKEDGRGQYCFFEPEMDATIKLRKQLESGLRAAITEKTIEVVYQPQVDQYNRIVGVEALARWSHPERGPISPGYFVPLAEECGLMLELGALIMEKAMSDAHHWNGLKVAVNVSATQLRNNAFIPHIRALMLANDIHPSQIEIEITEGVLLNDDQTTQMLLGDLRHMGFSIALDDFGTGYSSLSYLNRYPVDKIKIDRSFVSNLGTDPEAEAVIRAIIKLTKALNLSVLAEGVETPRQRQVLKNAGCVIIQGYLFSRPVPAADITAMLRASHNANLIHSTQSQALQK